MVSKNQVLQYLKSNNYLKISLVALFFAMSMSFLAFSLGTKIINTNAQIQFETDNNIIENSLLTNINHYKEAIIGLRAFLASNPNVNANKFNEYINNVEIKKNYIGLDVLNYAEFVPNNKIDTFYDNLDTNYKNILNTKEYQQFKINLNLNRSHLSNEKIHYIIKYISPYEKSNNYIGKDISNYPGRYKPLIETLNNDNFLTSGKLLDIKDDKDNTYLVLPFRLNVFLNNKSSSENFIGSVGAGIQLNELFKDLKNKPDYVNIQLYDAGTNEDKLSKISNNLIYDSRYQKNLTNQIWPKEIIQSSLKYKFQDQDNINIGNHSFIVHYFTNQIPPNVTGINVLYFICLLTFLVSYLLVQKLLYLRFEKTRAETIAKKMTKNLYKLAHTDFLTGLNNRYSLIEDLSIRIEQQPNKKFFLLFIDLDGFKKVNDTIGHQAGDTILFEYGTRIQLLAEKMQFQVYRIGGDEFTIILDPEKTYLGNTVKEFEIVMTDIFSTMNEPFKIHEEKFLLSQSIGVASYPEHGKDGETLFKYADFAMYEAKKIEQNSYMLFSESLNYQLQKKSKIERYLIQALENKELYLMYQPKVKLEGKYYIPYGAEVLIRWKNNILGEIPPMEFIPIAEDIGLISSITYWVLNEAASKIKEWNLQDKNIVLSINFSAKQFLSDNLFDDCMNILKKHDVQPSSIVIEITETAMINDPNKTRHLLQKLKDVGFQISVDDFGTNYSSLNYLRHFPVDEIKIDKSFTQDLLIDYSDAVIVEGVILMANKLGMKVVAEGTETIEQINWLVDHGCQSMQGYYFSKPLLEQPFIQIMSQKFDAIN